MNKYIILGAGPAGLTFANLLKIKGENSFLVIEAQSEAGGLCRSAEVDGAPLDIGGGHFLDVRRPNVNDFLFKFMPREEWNLYTRNSKININNGYVDYPIEANIWQMSIEDQIAYLMSVAAAGCNQGKEMPERFVDWIYWKLGDRIAEDYMIPYNSKIFGKNLNELGTYWIEKLPNVSFENTLRSCLEHKVYGEQPGHAQYYYPGKYGYGELWRRMAESIKDNIIYSTSVNGIDFDQTMVYCADGARYMAEKIVTSIPWREMTRLDGMPESMKGTIHKLKHSSIQVRYYQENMDTEAHWIYYPNADLSYHRILVRHNFCPNSKGFWTETNCNNLNNSTEDEKYIFYNKYAYPLNTLEKPAIMKQLKQWCERRNVYPLGRWGEHQHYNSDLTVQKTMNLFTRI